MSLYPSLEDMQVGKIMQAQQVAFQSQQPAPSPYPVCTQNPYNGLDQQGVSPAAGAIMYPDLADFMGMELTREMIAANMPELVRSTDGIVAVQTNVVPVVGMSGMVAPLSGSSLGMQRAQVTNGVRELIMCKGADNKVGLRVKDINKGIFVSIVVRDSPAAMAGLRFGDQILQINGNIVAGYSVDQLHKLFKKSPSNNISVVVRDRPFERSITLHKDSRGRLGFQMNNGRIVSIIKDSSAARNGVLIDHHLLEINGQNVVGLKDKETSQLMEQGGQIITITVVPSFIYEHMMTKLSASFIRGIMDHSTDF